MDIVAAAALLGLGPKAAELALETGRRILGSKSLDVADLMLADTFYRTACLRRIAFIVEIRDALERHGISPRALPEGFALQAIESGACADDEDVRRLWRNLVANAVQDPTKADPFVAETLRKLSGNDARVLLRVPVESIDTQDGLPAIGPGTEPGLRTALMRLEAHGLVVLPWHRLGGPWVPKESRVSAKLSEVGQDFLAAVADPVAVPAAP